MPRNGLRLPVRPVRPRQDSPAGRPRRSNAPDAPAPSSSPASRGCGHPLRRPELRQGDSRRRLPANTRTICPPLSSTKTGRVSRAVRIRSRVSPRPRARAAHWASRRWPKRPRPRPGRIGCQVHVRQRHPGTAFNARSTRATQDAQVMPLMGSTRAVSRMGALMVRRPSRSGPASFGPSHDGKVSPRDQIFVRKACLSLT